MAKEDFFTCVSIFFTELAKQPIKSAFALILLYLGFSADESQKQQILDALLKSLESPTSILWSIILFVLLLISLYFNAILSYKNYMLKREKGGA